MTKGKAYGKNLEYQKLCSNIIKELSFKEDLVPYVENGIDVTLNLCGTEVTFDVVLKNPKGKLVVLECKRWNSPIKQGQLFEFAFKVECLRKELNVDVGGLFVTKTDYQIGAMKVATNTGIDVAVCKENQSLKQFFISYKKYNPQREKFIQETYARLTGNISFTGTLSAKIIHKNGTIEDLGEL